ncbi:MAG: glycosyltransferase [Planctomycetes bacterium]|nr:glycosyltransferase [Planctomycetota bacterium]
MHPRWEPWLDELPFGRVLYDCIDDLAVHAPDPALRVRVARLEERLLARCDGALATAEVLLADLRRRRPELPLRLVRNGVDDVGFQRAAQGPRPADLPRGHPLVGFVGALYEWLDWELVRAVARACPEVDFAFVGPRAGEAAGEPAPGLANVRLLGPRPYADVPRYVAAFDACWVPFRVDRVGRAANPVKLYEYLALGKPACSTPVADLNSFEGLVSAAEGAEAMTQALRAALAEGAARATERRAFAARNGWSARAAEVLAFAGSLARV